MMSQLICGDLQKNNWSAEIVYKLWKRGVRKDIILPSQVLFLFVPHLEQSIKIQTGKIKPDIVDPL